MELNVCFTKHEQGNTFAYEYRATPISKYSGDTFLVDQTNPNKQHFFLVGGFVDYNFEFEVNFSENELEKREQFCTAARLLETSNYR